MSQLDADLTYHCFYLQLFRHDKKKEKKHKKEAALTSDRGHRSGLLFLTAGIADMLLFVMFLSQDSMSMASRFN